MCCLNTFQILFYKIVLFSPVTLQYDVPLRSINILSSAIVPSCDFHRIQSSNKIPNDMINSMKLFIYIYKKKIELPYRVLIKELIFLTIINM